MAICLLVPMSSLSRLSARSLFPIQSSSGCLSSFLLFPPHRMSGELVKTARADRSSVKPLQFIPVSSPPRIGCRTMCPTGCLPAASCAVIVLIACRFAHPSRPAAPPCVSCLASPVCLISTPRPAYPPRLSCRQAGRHHLVLISSCVSPAAPACLLTALRSARSRVAVADVIASLMRSVATVPPLPRLACAVGCFSRHVCAILCAVAMGTIG